MSDIFGGFVSKEINSKEERKVGFTLRVGGGRSPVNDRRNWDGYIVKNKVVRIKPAQGLQMMGFPKNFKMPVSENQAILNSVQSYGLLKNAWRPSNCKTKQSKL